MDPYISIDQLITSEKFDLITFFTEAGGNATSAMRRALIVQPNSEFKVFKDDISSPTGVFVPSLKDEVIEIDLGYVNGQKKSIKITSDGLISIGKLSTKDLVATTYENCQWIIKDLFPLCAESKESCKNVLENQSMSIKRSIIIFENNPNFSKKNLSVMCDDVCRWRKVRFTNEQISHLICRLDMSK